MPLQLQISIILRSISNAKFKNYGEHFNIEQNEIKKKLASISREKMSAMRKEKTCSGLQCANHTHVFNFYVWTGLGL